MRVRYTRRAVRNLEDIFEFIVRETSKSGIRRFPVVGYPYLVFYESLKTKSRLFTSGMERGARGRAGVDGTRKTILTVLLPARLTARAARPKSRCFRS